MIDYQLIDNQLAKDAKDGFCRLAKMA